MKATYLIAGCAVLTLAACTESPTTAAPNPAPSFSGFGFGSGHIVEADTTDYESAAAPHGTAADGDGSVDERSGFGFGSGH